ncbi:Urokinase-type plasminogen activator [Collichthys lucidus]|uniref:trypsin n=1 Tax=Collichthys lucidus TaxID=240159 RepID=A0A4U5VF21_COLLU|nr:Urokinase-type plasminogen activator [Collichthys lucidus]
MKLLVIVALLAALSVDVAFSRKKSWSRKNLSTKSKETTKGSTPTAKPLTAVDTGSFVVQMHFQLNDVSGVPSSMLTDSSSIESQPWIAAIFLRNGKRFNCGGSLISPCWVVTAAHCFPDGNETNIEQLSVYLGKTNIKEEDAEKEQRFTVEKLIIHQEYKDGNFNHDIALLKIRNKNGECATKSASARTVCLPPLHTQLPAGFQCSIAGFGMERHMAWHFSNNLKQTNVKLISQADCKSESYYGDLITKNMFCAGSPDWSTDACSGDSGGPLVCEVSGRMFLFGVVSWGDGCARKNKPGVYTQVTNYNEWIAENAGLSKFTSGLMYPMK